MITDPRFKIAMRIHALLESIRHDHTKFARRFYNLQNRYPTFKVWTAVWLSSQDPGDIPVHSSSTEADTIRLKDFLLHNSGAPEYWCVGV